MAIKRFKINGLNIKFVFRHKWEKREFFHSIMEFRRKEIGIWWQKSHMVGTKDFHDATQWSQNLVPSYMLGFTFIFCKGWVTVDYKGKHLKM